MCVQDELDLCMVTAESFGLGGDLEQFGNDNCDDIDCGVKLEM